MEGVWGTDPWLDQVGIIGGRCIVTPVAHLKILNNFAQAGPGSCGIVSATISVTQSTVAASKSIGARRCEEVLDKLRKTLSYDPATGIFRWKIKRANMEVGERAGNFNVATGYRSVMVDYKVYYEHRLAYAFIFGKFPPKKLTIDHINGKRDDNRIANLRLLPQADNSRSRTRLNKNNTSGVNGVSWNRQKRVWIASIMINRKSKRIGAFATLARAKTAREEFYAEQECASRDAQIC